MHWAHQIRDRFPDGQLYINLRGFDPAGSAMEPAEAIRAFLDAFALPPDRIPPDLDAQAALYRTLLADRRVLIVLDNARDSSQVRPLLPGTPLSLVIVTSRNQLLSLVATDGAQPIGVDLLAPGEARTLLVRRLGKQRIAAEPAAVDQRSLAWRGEDEARRDQRCARAGGSCLNAVYGRLPPINPARTAQVRGGDPRLSGSHVPRQSQLRK